MDDDADIRRLIVSIVLQFVNEIRECADGVSALKAYEEQRPDLVLMDICLPGLDGLAATRQIKAADPVARIVIVTDYDDDALRLAAKEAGACGYVLKDNLLDLVRLLDQMQLEY